MRTICVFAALLTLLALTIAPARASTTLIVTTTIDATDSNPGDGMCETMPGNGTCSLRAAIQEANALAGSDTIQLPAGTYFLSLPATEPDSAGGDLDITSPITLTGAGALSTIIDANGIDRVLHVNLRGDVIITGVTLQHGVTTEGDGAGLYLARGHVEVHESIITNNQNLSPYYQSNGGGGINNFGRMELFDTTVSNNYAQLRGGGIVNSERLRMVNSIVSGNSTQMYGGGLYNVHIATLRNTTVRGNTAGLEGGGIMNHYETPTLDIIKSTIADNSSNIGGGLINYSSATLTNVTVSGNTASSFGGGIYNSALQGDPAPLHLVNVTVTNNEAVSGGGGVLFGAGPATIQNSILAGNRVFDGPSRDCAGTVTSQGYNLIQQPEECTIEGDQTGVLIGIDPLLGPLQANGGRTDTHALLAQSPAIDAGNPAGCLDVAGEPLPTDQRGVNRPKDGDRDGQARCDLGAFERKPHENSATN